MTNCICFLCKEESKGSDFVNVRLEASTVFGHRDCGELAKQLEALLKNGKLIAATRLYKDTFGGSVEECKDAVTDFMHNVLNLKFEWEDGAQETVVTK